MGGLSCSQQPPQPQGYPLEATIVIVVCTFQNVFSACVHTL